MSNLPLREGLNSIHCQQIIIIVFIYFASCWKITQDISIQVLEEEDVTGSNVSMDNFKLS